jgi:cell division GTPase FtsZ
MTILILSLGGGGGNVLRSLKTLFHRDVATAQKSDPRHAERIRRAVVTRFLDTNAFSLSDVPREERFLIGAQTTRRLGSRHNPELARQAFEESKAEVGALLSGYSVVILVGTGGKGTGAGTIFPIAQMARRQRKLVIPIFVRPSFEWHEVEKRRYDHALAISQQFDTAGIRMIEILNDRGYSSVDPQPQSVVWERMNRPIARGLRGLLYVLSDLSQVDPSDLSALFAGPGRLRVGFSEIVPPADGSDPSDEQVQEAVRSCWDNPYSVFAEAVGTSLICIQGRWSNVVDGKLKGGLARMAANSSTDASYNPLYARASDAPKPWGITALFAEYTGNHPPLDIDWPEARAIRSPAPIGSDRSEPVIVHSPDKDVERPVSPVIADRPLVADRPIIADRPIVADRPVAAAGALAASGSSQGVIPNARETQGSRGSFSTFWEFALALNRLDPAAMTLAVDGVTCEMSVEGAEIKKLLGTLWFRSVFARLSTHWRERILATLLHNLTPPNHAVKVGRRTMHLSHMTCEELKQSLGETILSDAVRTDVQLLVTIATLWGKEALERVEFQPVEDSSEPSALAFLLQPFRHTHAR